MASFSERYGIVPERPLQTDNLDERTRNRIWNRVKAFLPDRYMDTLYQEKFANILFDELGLNADHATYVLTDQLSQLIRYEAEWFEVYETLELVANLLDMPKAAQLAEAMNKLFEIEKCGYRIIESKDGASNCYQVLRITNETELEAIQEAAQTEYDAINSSIRDAISRFSDFEEPDYAGSVQASISAVESAFRLIDPKATTLGKALGKLKKENAVKHRQLIDALDNIYAFANTTVRHGQRDLPEITQAEAKVVLVTCSGIINYIFEESVSIAE